MTAPKITPSGLSPAKRTYSFALTDAEPMTDREGRLFQPRAMQITITDDSLHAGVSGTHIKTNGTPGIAHRSISWYCRISDGPRGSYISHDTPLPLWVALKLYQCQHERPIDGPNWPEEWAAVLP